MQHLVDIFDEICENGAYLGRIGRELDESPGTTWTEPELAGDARAAGLWLYNVRTTKSYPNYPGHE